MLTWKLRITVLWIFLAVCQSANMALLMLGPGVLHGLMAGQLWGATPTVLRSRSTSRSSG